jgi:hypothetical protein
MALTFRSSIQTGHASVTFSEKPPEKIRAMLKAHGFRWSPVGGFWWRSRVKGVADFLAALDRACNPGKPDGACWKCQSPQGFFRRQGAATPVYCDACYAVLNTPDRTNLDYEDACARACGL